MTHESDRPAPNDEWISENEASSPEAAPPGSGGGSFFKFWRCCGCLAVLGFVIVLAGVMIVRWGIDNAFQTEPMEFPPLAYTEEQANEIRSRFETGIEAGEVVTLTPEELTILLQSGIDGEDSFGPESRFHCEATPDGLLDLRLSIQIPEGRNLPWFVPEGRFVNIGMVGNFTIEEGDLTDAKLESYRFGGFAHQDSIPADESKQLMDQLRQQSEIDPDFRATVDRVKRFRFDGEKIELAIEPQ